MHLPRPAVGARPLPAGAMGAAMGAGPPSAEEHTLATSFSLARVLVSLAIASTRNPWRSRAAPAAMFARRRHPALENLAAFA